MISELREYKDYNLEDGQLRKIPQKDIKFF